MANVENRSASSPPGTASLLSLAVAQLIYPYMGEGEGEDDESSTFLPYDIIVAEILPRLHIKPLFRFKCASKRYRSIISHPVFAQNYMHRAYNNPSPESFCLFTTLLYPFTNLPNNGFSVNFEDLTDTLNSSTQFRDDQDQSSSVFLSFVPSLPYSDNHKILSSSKGLILSQFHPYKHSSSELDQLIVFLCVSNPLTKHCVKLPSPSESLNSVEWEFAITTRLVQQSLTYKVLAIHRGFDWNEPFTLVHIFCSDTGNWATWKAFCSREHVTYLPTEGCFAYNGIMHFLDSRKGKVLTYDPYHSPDRFNVIPLPIAQASHSCLIYSGEEEMLKFCCEVEEENKGDSYSGVDRLLVWRLVDSSEWCLEGEFMAPCGIYECNNLMVAPNPWNRDLICHPLVMINRFTALNLVAGTREMVPVFDNQTFPLEFCHDISYLNPLIPIELCPWSSPCYASS